MISGLFFQVRTEYGKLRKEADILEGHALRYESLNLWHVIKNILSSKIEEYVKPICGMIPDVTLSFVVGVAISLSKGCTMAMKIFSKKMLKALRKATEDFVFETGILTGKEDEAKILNTVANSISNKEWLKTVVTWMTERIKVRKQLHGGWFKKSVHDFALRARNCSGVPETLIPAVSKQRCDDILNYLNTNLEQHLQNFDNFGMVYTTCK